jgi:DNA-binding CsgD family transcriptional regulator
MRSAISDVADFAASVLDGMDGPDFPAEAVFALLCPALDAPGAVLQRTDWLTGDTQLVTHGVAAADAPRLIEATRRLRFEHPLLVATAAGHLEPNTAQRAAGGRSRWQRSPARSFLVEVGGTDQMVSVGLRGGPREVCGLAFARTRTDFDDREIDLLSAVQPFLQAVDRHVRQLSRWRRDTADGCDDAVTSARDAGLTGREVSVLALLAQGCSAVAIAHRLGCSPRTVHKHVGSVYRKLGVADRLSAVLEGQRRGMLRSPMAAGTVLVAAGASRG